MVLLIHANGIDDSWLRLFFYANERNEPVHIHCKKSDSECKYWLDIEDFNIQEAYIYNCSQNHNQTHSLDCIFGIHLQSPLSVQQRYSG